jgi:hypothetical protein
MVARSRAQYVTEFDFRYSHKDISDRDRADKALISSFDKRLTERRTAALAGERPWRWTEN